MGCLFHGFYNELELVSMISIKKVIFGWISGLKEAKNDWNFADQWLYIYAVSNNAITSEINKMFSWNKKQGKANKIVFLPFVTFGGFLNCFI